MYDMYHLMCAYIKGYIIENNIYSYENLIAKDILNIDENDINRYEEIGKKLNLKLYHFKEKNILPRVNVVLGFIKSIYPDSLLDVGSGVGRFLFPLLCENFNIDILSIDILDDRIKFLKYLQLGGISNLTVLKDNICTAQYDDNKYQVVTLLEVLEHIPNYKDALENAIRISKEYIIISVPSKEDNNPEHIHLLTKEILTNDFNSFGITNLKFSGVLGHLILIARK